MSANMAMLVIVARGTFIILGFTMKQFNAIKGAAGLGRPIKRWQGRLLFVFIGSAFLAVGIGFFLRDR